MGQRPNIDADSHLFSTSPGGERETATSLLEVLYDELRILAHQRMAREPAGLTLDATALVHEVYLRLIKDDNGGWEGRAHFFAVAAEAMRRILVERARRYARPGRGGGWRRLPIECAEGVVDGDLSEMLAIDEALDEMERVDPRMSKVVKLRFFAGFTVEETARALCVSPRTVKTDWRCARAWLYRRLRDEDETGRNGRSDDGGRLAAG